MGRMRGKRAEPMLMGVPSPSLAKINKMNTDELVERIAALGVERERIATKIKNLSAMTPRDEARITELKTQASRLTALENVAKDRLSGKNERREQREQVPGTPGAPGNTGNTGSVGYSRSPGATGNAAPGQDGPRRLSQRRRW